MPQIVVKERQWWLSVYKYAGATLFVCLLFSFTLHGQEDPQRGLMYGEVLTVDDNRFTGVLRWGNEEAFWDDLFISSKKPDRELFNYLSGQQLESLSGNEKEESDWSFWSLWEPRYPEVMQSFRARYGDLSSIEVTGPDVAIVTIKNGERIEVSGGNGLGKELHIFDRDEVERRVSWEDIDEVTFLPTPSNARSSLVKPLAGIVFTTQGAFEGFLQWDAQERLTTDILDGKGQDGKQSIPFSQIEEIRQAGDSSVVTLFTGEVYTLGGGDDVGPGNHDIIVKSPGLGHVRIPWEQFRFARFYQQPDIVSPGYDQFRTPQTLYLTVKLLNGTVVSGPAVFDLDERLDFETLEGRKEEIFYHIPIRNIEEIIRKNYRVSRILFRNGDELYLQDEHDLTDRNWGLLVTDRDEEVHYLPWNQIEYIRF